MHIFLSVIAALFLAGITALTGYLWGETVFNSLLGGGIMGVLSFLLLWLDKDASPTYTNKT